MVENYSHRSLTYQTDNLPAISEIAKLLHGMTQDDYYAGLWSSQLPEALLWLQGKSTMRIQRARSACLLGVGLRYAAAADIDIVSVDIQPSGSNAFGGVLGIKLEVETVLIPIQATSILPYSVSTYNIIDPEKKWAIERDMIYVNLDPYYYDPNKPTESAIEVKKYDSLFLIFVGTLKSEDYAENPSFLALRYLKEDERGNSIFRRAGVTFVDEWSMYLLDRIQAATKESIVLI
ncbi:hypothetical protein BPAE_0025g00470 [Botrytis paeoniae]|uniref:Uncharacterized protein n=1 Tax=Botrytis paeoniae TaxID=278948 RepID=A0A4Z1FYB5_9HELO|nr:hypothetical protein BPAE_0025g00470 [Botrytis paeoniae]